MPITEDDVKNAVATWLRGRGFQNVVIRLGTRHGIDVEGIDTASGKRLVVECKGEGAADQWRKSWYDVSGGILTVLNHIETPENPDDVGLAFPDTSNYRTRMAKLEDFCRREGIAVYWVTKDSQIKRW